MMKNITAHEVEALVNGCTTRTEVLEAIGDLSYEDLTEGYLDIRIPTRDGYIRIYRAYDRQMELVQNKDRIRVREYRKVRF